MADVYDAEILPLWGQRLARLFLPTLTIPARATVLNVGCATGYEALEILRRREDCRVIAIDPSGPLLEVARRKAGDLTHKRIFFRGELLRDKLRFADDVFDLVLCAGRLLEFSSPRQALQEFARVCKSGAQVIVTLPLAGTWNQFFDIYREVLTKHDKTHMLERLDEHIAWHPSAELALEWMEAAGLADVSVELEEFELLFKSSREFFFAPIIEYGPLSSWKEIAGKGEEMQQVFWHIKEAIDTYFGERAFQVTIKAACLQGRKAVPLSAASGDAAQPETEKARTVETPAVDATRESKNKGTGFLEDEDDGDL